jgi:hypothetical protein
MIFVSTFHDRILQDGTTRKGTVQKPTVVVYNKNMGGVDKKTIRGKVIRWHVKGFTDINR